ncbi:MAG: hypothetical protein Q9168_001257 [Polycauliona sp. 1 TL-2023]
MSSELATTPHVPKRKLDTEETSELTAIPISKRPKLNHKEQPNFPPCFWDDLSRLFLTPRALREFNRRTARLIPPVQLPLTGAEEIEPTQLVQFAEEGGPDLRDLRDYPRSQEANVNQEASSTPTMSAADGKNTSAYDPHFEQHLIDHGCYPKCYPDADANDEARPKNFEALRTMLQIPTASSSALTTKDFTNFRNANKKAKSESMTMSGEINQLAGVTDILHAENKPFNKSAPLIPTSKGQKIPLTQPQPDSYDGHLPESLSLKVRNLLGAFIVPSKETNLPCLPNLFMEGKGVKGDSDVAMRQALYDGCVGARGVHELRGWLNPNTMDDGNAYVIACTYESGPATLFVYTIHPQLSNKKDHRQISSRPKKRYNYIMSQLFSVAMTDDHAGFIRGINIYRNARQWAKKQRDQLVAAANAKASLKDAATSPSDLQEYADELNMDGASG